LDELLIKLAFYTAMHKGGGATATTKM